MKVNKSELQRYLYKEFIRLSVMVDEQLKESSIFGKMSALVRKAKMKITAEDEREKLSQLLDLFYNDWGFQCDAQEYFYADNLMINQVIDRRKGMPVALSAILLYLSAYFKIPLYPVSFPTQIILRSEFANEKGKVIPHFINPWDGKNLTTDTLEKWLEGEVGYEAVVTPDMLAIAEPHILTERLETVFKMALTREGRYEETLRLIEYRLIFNPEDPYEIRDRGMVLASMDCYRAALEDLDYFIAQCPDDPSALMLKLEIPTLEQQSRAYRLH